MPYTININYQTGSSFHTEDCEEDIGLIWNDKKLAQKALQSIKEHYELYQELDSCHSVWSETRTRDEVMKDIESRDWYHKVSEGSFEYWQCQAEMDDGTFRNIPTDMWCGYFETLYGADVISLGNDADSFKLN